MPWNRDSNQKNAKYGEYLTHLETCSPWMGRLHAVRTQCGIPLLEHHSRCLLSPVAILTIPGSKPVPSPSPHPRVLGTPTGTHPTRVSGLGKQARDRGCGSPKASAAEAPAGALGQTSPRGQTPYGCIASGDPLLVPPAGREGVQHKRMAGHAHGTRCHWRHTFWEHRGWRGTETASGEPLGIGFAICDGAEGEYARQSGCARRERGPRSIPKRRAIPRPRLIPGP